MRRVGEVHQARMKKGTCESGKMGRRPVAFESAHGSAIDRRRGRQGAGVRRRMESTRKEPWF
jgi:hypothetical protein